eukprot:3186850-Alexandrium_andersonii.AAC.1
MGPATPTTEVTMDAESDEEAGSARRGELDPSESADQELNFLQLRSGFLRPAAGGGSASSQPIAAQ